MLHDSELVEIFNLEGLKAADKNVYDDVTNLNTISEIRLYLSENPDSLAHKFLLERGGKRKSKKSKKSRKSKKSKKSRKSRKSSKKTRRSGRK